MITNRRIQCQVLRQLIASGPGPYARHHANATRVCMKDMETSGYLIKSGRKTGSGDDLYEINPGNPYAVKLLRDSQAGQHQHQTKITGKP